MIKSPAVPVSEYTETKTVFLLQILAEKSCTETETELKLKLKILVLSFIFAHYFFIQKLSKI